MKHSIFIEAFSFRLRPATMSDSPFIVALRNDSKLSKYIGATSGNIRDQEHWFESYNDREGDYYFIIEDKQGCREGTIGLYNIDVALQKAEWGRWVLVPDSKAATESAWLIYSVAFDTLGLHDVYCRTLEKNVKVLSFHNSSGAKHSAVLTDYISINGEMQNAVEHSLTRHDWPTVSFKLSRLSERLGKLLQQGKPTHDPT